MKKKYKTLQELRKAGFCRIGKTPLFIDNNGNVYNMELQTARRRPRYIATDSEKIRLEAAILWAFKNEPPRRNKTIIYKDGNKNNLNPDNLKYRSLGDLQKTELNTKGLYEAIRKVCFVDRLFKVDIKQIETRVYLQIITEKYGYILKKTQHNEVFESYVNEFETITQTANRHKITVRDTQTIINNCINEITTTINNEKEKMLPTVKKPTYKQKLKSTLKEWNKLINDYGL